MIIDCHGHYTTAPAALQEYRDAQLARLADPAQPMPPAPEISDDEIRRTIERLAGEPVTEVGVDGCGAPLFAISLTGLARAFGALVRADPGSPERRVADAMRAFLVVGDDERDIFAAVGADVGDDDRNFRARRERQHARRG